MATVAGPDDTATTPDRGGLEFGRLLLYGLALASLAAGIIHCSAALDHAHGDLPWHAALFVVTAALQLAWAGVILRRSSRRWLVAGLVVNFALVAAWVLSRSTGVPVIPGAQEVEPLGFKDVTTAFFELAVVIGVGLFAALPLAVRRLRLPAGRLAFGAMLTAVLMLVFFGLSQAPHSHGGQGHRHGEEAALTSGHHHDGDGEDHHDSPATGGDAQVRSGDHSHAEVAAGHSHNRSHGAAAGTAEAIGPAAAAHEHDAGDVHDDGHIHDASTSPSNRPAPSGGSGHSHSESAPAGSGHHRHGDPEQSPATTPGKEPEGHDHSSQPTGGSEGDDHGGGGASPGNGGHDHSGGHDHGDPESDPAPEEAFVKAFFAFLNTVTKAAGLDPV